MTRLKQSNLPFIKARACFVYSSLKFECTKQIHFLMRANKANTEQLCIAAAATRALEHVVGVVDDADGAVPDDDVHCGQALLC